jgi:predicted glycoside hydrolase/deacetylase ChbG (UPF0249 family)
LRPLKQLVVNADDFGADPDVNQGIAEGRRRGILTAATLMATGEAFEDAVRLARETPTLDLGAHLTLTGGRSLLTGRPLPATVARLLAALARREIAVYDELQAQVRRLLAAGVRPTHFDTHKHAHLAPPVLEAVARLAQECGVRWVRAPFDLPLRAAAVPFRTRLARRGMGLLCGRFRRVLERRGLRTTDHFVGFQLTGRLGLPELVELLSQLPEGSTELMCHPGRCGPALRASRTRLKESRERELEALISGEARAAVERNGIELAGFGALG